MEPLLIVHIINESANLSLSITERLVLAEIHLLTLECLEKAFGFGIVVGIAFSRHAHLRADAKQALNIGGACILHASIRMMDHPRTRLTKADRMVQCSKRQLRINRSRELPANAASRPGVQDTSEINERRRKPDIRDVG